MAKFTESLLRQCVRSILLEDIYDSAGSFSPDRLQATVQGYLQGELPSLGVSPGVASEVVLEDLRAAFFAMGYDSDSQLQRDIARGNIRAAEDRVWDILSTDFIGTRGPLAKMNLKSISDILLPGDEDVLLQMIVNSVRAGDVF